MSDEPLLRLDDMPVIAALLDRTGSIIGVNAAWRTFGQDNGHPDPGCSLGSNYVAVCETATGDRADLAAEVADGIRAVLRGEQRLFVLDYPCHGPDAQRWYKLLVGPVADPPGAITLHVDITQQKLAELEVDRRRSEAERAVALRNRFLAAAGHDLRQPLQAAELFAELLDKEVEGEKAKTLVRHLSSALQAQAQILDSLSDLSRLESGTQPVAVRRFPLRDLLLQVAAEAAALAAEKGLALHCVDTSVEVETDPLLLGRILRNLIHNALTYTEQGRVLIGVRRRTGGVEIQVVDTGVGIAVEHQQAVFGEFFRVDGDGNGRGKGLGLGLSIVHRLGRLLGLRVCLASKPGRGTMLGVRIPHPTRPGRPGG